MYYKVVNKTEIDQVISKLEQGKLLEMEDLNREDKTALIAALKELGILISILDDNYGIERHPETDLGGFSYVLPTLKDYQSFYGSLMQKHNIDELLFEYQEIVSSGKTVEFVQAVYQLSSDYSIILVYPKEKKANE